MIDASSAKKSLKKLVNLIEDTMEAQGTEAKNAGLSELIEYMRDNMEIIREAVTEQTSSLLSYLVVDTYKSGLERLDDLLDIIGKVDPENPIVGEYEIVSLLDRNNYAEIINRVTGDPEYSKSPGIMEVLRKSALNSGELVPVVRYYSRCGLFDRELFAEYAAKKQDEGVNTELINNYESEGLEEELVRLLEALADSSANPAYRIKLVYLYMKREEKENLPQLLKKIDPDDVGEAEDYLAISHANEYVSDYSRALLFASSGLSHGGKNRDLMLQRGRMLIFLNREGEAAEALSSLVEAFPKDAESVRLVASIYYKTGDYKSAVKYLGILGDLAEYDLSDYIMLIDSRINLSYFDEATRSIRDAISRYGASLDLLQYKLRLERIINDQSKAFATAQQILEIDAVNTTALEIKFSYLYEKEEYRKFAEEFTAMPDSKVKEDLLDRYAGSLMFTGRFDDSMSVLSSNPILLSSGPVLDAVFYTVRDDAKIGAIRELCGKTPESQSGGMMVVINRILGVKPPFRGDVSSLAIASRSFALGFIICMEGIDFKEKATSKEADAILSTSFFKEVSDAVDLIRGVYSGRGGDQAGLSDSPRLLYPVVSALVDVGDNERARDVLDRSYNSRLQDPFYYYYNSILNLRKGNSSAARKSLKRALSKLSNNEFMTLEAEILLSDEDVDEVRESLVKLAERGVVQSINFREIYNYVSERNDYAAGRKMMEALSPFNVENFWLYKLERDVLESEGALKGALDASSLVVSNRKRSFSDIKIHVSLLDRLGMKDEKITFLQSNSGEHESSEIDLWLGDAFYDRKDYESALECYESARKKDVDPSAIIHYADTLLQTGRVKDAAPIIGNMKDPGILRIKLFYAQGNIEGIVAMLKSTEMIKGGDEEKFTYVAENLWSNRLIRDALVKAYRSEGYQFLGRLISRKMVESGDLVSAEDIMENLLRNYPDDMETVANLSDAYIKLGKRNDAVSLLLGSLKYISDFNTGMAIVNRLLRIYYEDSDFQALTKFYEGNSDYVDTTALQFVVRSYISLEEFDAAEKIVGKYEGNLLDRQLTEELLHEVKARKEFSEILIFVRRILRLEYKAGKIFTMKEALYRAEVPIEKIEPVFEFIGSEEYYSDVNEEKYEILSRDVFQEIAKKTRVQSLSDIKLNIIFNNLPGKDVIVAKNLYIYIKRCLAVVRDPKINDEVLVKLLRIAFRDKLRPEPLNIAVNLNVGISDALEVIALMNYMEHMDGKGGQ